MSEFPPETPPSPPPSPPLHPQHLHHSTSLITLLISSLSSLPPPRSSLPRPSSRRPSSSSSSSPNYFSTFILRWLPSVLFRSLHHLFSLEMQLPHNFLLFLYLLSHSPAVGLDLENHHFFSNPLHLLPHCHLPGFFFSVTDLHKAR